MVIAASLTVRAPVAARPAVLKARPARRLAVVPRANALTDVGRYLSEAASQIFRPQANDMPWKGSGTPFTGSITHHEEPTRLRLLYEMTESMRKDLEASGAKPEAAAAASEEPAAAKEEDGGLQEYMTTAVARLFGHNFTGDEGEPKEWSSAGYKESWGHGTTRDVQRRYNRLIRFQKVVKKTLEEVEVKK